MAKYIDAAGLTQAPINLDAYVRALGISGYLIRQEDRLSVLWQMHQAEESHVVYTGPAGASYWRLASPRVVVRIVPGEGEVSERIADPALYYLLEKEGLSRSRAQAILKRKTTTPAREAAFEFANSTSSPPPQLPLIGDSPSPGTEDRRPYSYREVSDAGSFVALANALERAKREGITVGLDTEGTSEDDRSARLVGIGIAVEDDTYYAPVGGTWDDAVRALCIKHLPGLRYIAHNAKYDYKMLKRHGFPIDKAVLVGDGMIAAYVLAEVDEIGRPRPKGLKPLALRWLGHQMQTFQEVLAIAGATDSSQVPTSVLGPYCADDAYQGVKVEERLRQAIVEAGIRLDLYEKLELPNVIFLAEMELAGMPVDVKTAEARRQEYLGKVIKERADLDHRAVMAGWAKPNRVTCKKHGRKRADIAACQECDEGGKVWVEPPFNPGSLKHLDELLRGVWGLPRMGFTATGQPSYNEDAVLALRERVRGQATVAPIHSRDMEEFLDSLLTWRGDSKILTTYLDKFAERTVESTIGTTPIRTIHPNFNQTVVESGRLSSDDPNAQNIPLDLRDLFVAPPGWFVWVADHSQLELRILARVSGCRAMIEAYQNDQDIHALTAWRVFGIQPRNLTPVMRVRAKTLNFGIAYEASPDAVRKQITRAALTYPELKIQVPTIKDCELLVREFFRAYPEVAQAVAFHHDKTRQLGYSTTMYGRRRYLPNITHPSQELRSRAERQAWNLVIQGTAGDIMKGGELVVYARSAECRADVRWQVHDELGGLVRQETADDWLRVVAESLVLDQPLRPVPLKVEPSIGRNWKEAK